MTSRRGFLGGAGGLAAAALTARPAAAAATPDTEPFWGPRQGGILTKQQTHSYFAVFDATARTQAELAAMLRAWTRAAARMAAGETAGETGAAPVAADGGTALGLSPARLTLTFGFGPGLFMKDGADRFGLARQRPQALIELPKFNGDQLDPQRTGGDISVQACADDPQVAFHAVRELQRLAYGRVELRWAQAGFTASTRDGETTRNLMGFKDGTGNPRPDATPGFDDLVFVADDGPSWLRGGSYLVARRIRISLEHWDRMETGYQEEVVGRRKLSGAPLTGTAEHDPHDFARVDADGNPVIPESAHARLGAAAMNGGAQMLRRAYSYNDGAVFTAERWPPWRQGMMYDAGLLFLAYQRDPRRSFLPMFARMAKLDAMNQFTTHVGSGLFAVPGGVAEGGFIGQGLFEAA